MDEANERSQPMRKSFACDECKRRKIRCSGGDRCTNCTRDSKPCRYSSPSQKLVSLQRRLRDQEVLHQDIEKAWKMYLPEVDLETALRNLRQSPQEAGDELPAADPYRQSSAAAVDDVEQPSATLAEHSNAEDYEFDESHDVERSIDGMAFLTADTRKAGYTGPQSGIAALKFLQSLPPYLPITYASPLPGPDDTVLPEASSQTPAAINRYIDDYFSLYHPAYPILHEGTFRARVSGALAKPRDGSWPLLYNCVVAIGAFVSDSSTTKCDIPFFLEARKHLSMDILEKGSLAYVQATVLLANYLQKRNKPNAGFILIGIAFHMALAIGLHREFDVPSTSPFTMEIRRRVWWTLFVFVSGAQLALGRPAASLVGINVKLPTNLDDFNLAVDMEELPPPKSEPTVSSCLISQIELAKIANTIHDELLTHRRPSYAKATKLEEQIRSWWNALPPYFDQNIVLEPRLELPKRILLWRSLNLRIVLNRPFLFEAIASNAQLSVSVEPIKSCLTAADECVASICGFLESLENAKRGFAWYATAWLITASFVQATCFIYSPGHTLAASWISSLHQAIRCLQILGSSHDIALRARDILQKVVEQRKYMDSCPEGILDSISSLSGLGMIPETPSSGIDQAAYSLSSIAADGRFGWLNQASSNPGFPEGEGALMYSSFFNIS